MSKKQFKVGQTVIVHSNASAASEKHNGEKAIVLKIENGDWGDDKESIELCGNHTYDLEILKTGEKITVWEKDIWALHETKKNKVAGEIIGGEFPTKVSGKRKTFSSGFQRDVDETKARYDLIPLFMLKRWAELYARGAKNYGERNWEKASTQEEADRFLQSAFRHFVQWSNGERDEDHAVAVFFNISGYEMIMAKLNGSVRTTEKKAKKSSK